MNVADLKLSMERYLAVRDALGFTNRTEKVLLPDFVEFVEEHSVSGPIRAMLAVEWACASASRHETSGQVRRLSIVRGFLSHLRATVPETEVPAFGLIAGARRPQPYLFTQAQLECYSKLLPAWGRVAHCAQIRTGHSSGYWLAQVCESEKRSTSRSGTSSSTSIHRGCRSARPNSTNLASFLSIPLQQPHSTTMPSSAIGLATMACPTRFSCPSKGPTSSEI